MDFKAEHSYCGDEDKTNNAYRCTQQVGRRYPHPAVRNHITGTTFIKNVYNFFFF